MQAISKITLLPTLMGDLCLLHRYVPKHCLSVPGVRGHHGNVVQEGESCTGSGAPDVSVKLFESASQDAGGWGVKLEALKLVVALMLNWRKATQHHLPSVLESAWALVKGCLPLYMSGVVRGDEDIDCGEVRPAQIRNAHAPKCSRSRTLCAITCAQ